MNKICKFCKKEIAKEAKVCPYCQKEQTKITGINTDNVLTIIVAFIVVAFIIYLIYAFK